MAGYTRQSLADIQDGEDIVAAPLNAEFDQLQDAFNAITGHTHDGTIGNGPKLSLTGSVSGILPLVNGGTGSSTASGARTNLGLGTAAVKNIGTSGDAVPLLNTANTWSAIQTFTANQGLVLNASSPTFRLIDADTGVEAHLSASSTVGSIGLNADVNSVGSSPNVNFDVRSVNKMSISETVVTVRVPISMASNQAISFAGTGAATTRTNLGLGAGSVDTWTNAQVINNVTYGGTINYGTATDYRIVWGGGAVASNSQVVISSNAATTSSFGAWMLLAGSNHASTPGQAILTSGAGGDIHLRNAGTTKVIVGASNIQMNDDVIFGDGDMGNGEDIVVFNTDRPWVVRQRGDTGTAHLSFENTTQKQIQFSSDASYTGSVITLSPESSDPFITIGGSRAVTQSWSGGLITTTTEGEALRLVGSATGDPYISFYKVGTRQGYIQHSDGTSSSNGMIMQNDVATGGALRITLRNTGGVDGLGFHVGASNYTVWHNGNLLAADLNTIYGFTPANSARQIIAGNGMTGGGTLAADRTLTLGTPSNITNSTTNSVTSTSHTHALGFTAAEVYTGSNVNELNFPLGHIILCTGGSTDRNATATPYNRAATNQYTTSPVGTVLTGTWRARGQDSDTWMILQRTA